MRFMMFMMGNQATEAGVMPGEELLAAMTSYNEQLVKAGVLLDASGLQPTSKGVRVRYSRGTRAVVDGPFTEAKEVVAGYWLLQVKSREEAVEWARRVPFEGQAAEGEVVLRQLFEMEDFAPGESIERTKELSREIERQKARRG